MYRMFTSFLAFMWSAKLTSCKIISGTLQLKVTRFLTLKHLVVIHNKYYQVFVYLQFSTYHLVYYRSSTSLMTTLHFFQSLKFIPLHFPKTIISVASRFRNSTWSRLINLANLLFIVTTGTKRHIRNIIKEAKLLGSHLTSLFNTMFVYLYENSVAICSFSNVKVL